MSRFVVKFWTFPFEPEDLWADRLRRKRVAATCDYRALADALCEFADLSFGASVDAVKNPVHQRVAIHIHGQHARADRTA